MRICIVSQEYPPETGGGGIGTQSYLKAQGLSARGHHVEVVSASWNNPRSEYDGKALVHRFKPTEFGLDAFDQSIEWMCYSLNVAQKLHRDGSGKELRHHSVSRICRRRIFSSDQQFPLAQGAYSVQLHGPLGMFAEHVGWPDKGSTLHTTGCFMEKSVIHHADGILASSRNTAGFCANYYDYPVERINVIHSGIDIEKFSPKPRRGWRHISADSVRGKSQRSEGIQPAGGHGEPDEQALSENSPAHDRQGAMSRL